MPKNTGHSNKRYRYSALDTETSGRLTGHAGSVVRVRKGKVRKVPYMYPHQRTKSCENLNSFFCEIVIFAEVFAQYSQYFWYGNGYGEEMVRVLGGVRRAPVGRNGRISRVLPNGQGSMERNGEAFARSARISQNIEFHSSSEVH